MNRNQKIAAAAGVPVAAVAGVVAAFALTGSSTTATTQTFTFTNTGVVTVPTVTETVTVTQPPAPPPAPPPPPVPPPPPPPGPVLGSSLPNPLFHVPNVGLTYWLDPVSGNDTTGTGSSGSPWKTLQKAHDYLANTATWPTNQDVQVLLKDGASYQAPSGGWTLDMYFAAGARSPNANRWLIFNAAPGASPVIENPTGSDREKGAIRLQNGTGTNYISFRHLSLYGGDTRRGSPGNGNSIGLYLSGDLNDNVEFIYGQVHGFQGGPNVSYANAQAVQIGTAGISGFKFAFNKVYDIGTTTGSAPFNEHGYYSHSTQGDMVLGNLFYNIVNGYNVQFYGVPQAGSHALIVNNTLTDAFASGLVIDDSGSGVILKNNVFAYHTGRGSSSWGIEFFPLGTVGSGNVVDHNAYFQNTAGNRSATPAGWSFTGTPVSTDPLFVSVAGNDFHLQNASPLYQAGDPNYTPLIDVDGTTRTQATIGAYASPLETAPGSGTSSSDLTGQGALEATAAGGIDTGAVILISHTLLSAAGVVARITTGHGKHGTIDKPGHGHISKPSVGRVAR